MSQPTRVAILTNVLAPYRVEFYRRLSAAADLEVHVLFGGDRRLSERWRWTPATGVRGEELSCHFFGSTAWNPTLTARLRALAPAAIVCGGVNLMTATAARYGRAHHVPLLIWWGGTALSEGRVTGLKRWWRQRLFGQAAGFFTYSSLAAQYLRAGWSHAHPIHVLGNNTMDASAWRARILQSRPPTPPARPIILGVGQLIPRKGYDLALAATARVARDHAFELVLTGAGDQEPALRQLARSLGIEAHVRFAGNLPHTETAALYAQATAFFHPARQDQWPQVVNEALAAGLPVLVSDTSGIPLDFVRDGENGFVRRCDDLDGWASCLQRLLTEPALARALGEHALATALAQDVNHAVAVFRQGIREATHS